jgi:hypothetical protein
VEIYEGDDSDDLASISRWDFNVPPVPEMPEVEFPEPFILEIPEVEFPPFPEVADLSMPPFPDMAYMQSDTFPELEYLLKLKGDWGVKEFNIRLKQKFGDFYDKNQEEIQKMMNEVSRDIYKKLEKEYHRSGQMEAQRNQEIFRAQADAQREAMRHQQLAMEEVHAQLERVHEEQEKNHAALERQMKVLRDKMHAFERELKEELIKDGYLGKNEKLENIHWNDDDEILEVNGKKVSAKDKKRYEDIRKKHLGDGFHYGKPE